MCRVSLPAHRASSVGAAFLTVGCVRRGVLDLDTSGFLGAPRSSSRERTVEIHGDRWSHYRTERPNLGRDPDASESRDREVFPAVERRQVESQFAGQPLGQESVRALEDAVLQHSLRVGRRTRARQASSEPGKSTTAGMHISVFSSNPALQSLPCTSGREQPNAPAYCRHRRSTSCAGGCAADVSSSAPIAPASISRARRGSSFRRSIERWNKSPRSRRNDHRSTVRFDCCRSCPTAPRWRA